MEQLDRPISIPPHPMGIKPLGNHFLAQDNAKNYAGLFQMLPEEVLAPLLEHLDSSLLLLIGSTCKYLYSLSKSDDLWKSLFIESVPPHIRQLSKSTSRAPFPQLHTKNKTRIKH